MNYEVVWLEKAENDLIDIIQYLKENWGEDLVNRFRQKIEKHINLITIMPKIFPVVYPKKNVRRSVIVKQISLYYIEFEVEQEIVIVRLLDNRRDPTYIAEELESI